ncbi:MAG: dihydrolipoamide acetyltransferase family protein [Anaerolineae bacterium]
MAKQVLVPPLGTTVDTVTLVSWYKAEGETIRKGEPLFVIETDKANLDVESPATGVLRGVNAVPGDEIKALTVIAFIAEADEVVSPIVHSKPTVDDKAIESKGRPEPIVVAENAGGRIFISPRARRLAEENHILTSQLKATGPEGAIIERDVRLFLQSHAVSALPSTTLPLAETTAPAQQLVGSHAEIAVSMMQGIPSPVHFTLTAEVDITQLAAWRSKLLETNIKPTYNSLILFALSRVLKAQPRLVSESNANSSAQSPHIDIGLAMAGGKRFVFPVIRSVEQKGLVQLATEERDLMAQIASGSMQLQTPDDCAIRLCNLGAYGIDTFTPWFYAPDCAVLGVGRIKEQRDMLDGKVSTRQMVWLSLTADIRQMDGLQAAQFMQALVRYLENPMLLIGV